MEEICSNTEIFKSVFRGREDVFAVRWEKGNKSGYMPAYFFDPYMYRTHKMRGGTFQNYADKTYLKLSDKEIEKHLSGEQQIGLYPLLTDNTSWFIVADFDGEKWVDESRIFIKKCYEKDIPAYLERSRSGDGGHVWIFFEQPYPAIRSRKIFISLLQQSGAFSIFDKSSSFDRLFPNQDFLSGKGFGNLIALPLFKKTFNIGNSCFIDKDTLKPIEDQWLFLKNIKKVSFPKLDNLYEGLSNTATPIINSRANGKLTIVLNNSIRISRGGLTSLLINFLKEELNFASSEFIIKKKSGRNTFGTERYFKFLEETENEVIIPKGFIGKLIRFCRENKIEHDFIDDRKKLPLIDFAFNAQLREHQQAIIDTISKKDLGVIVAPPGSGKTVIGLKLISDKQQPSLIIVHRKQLAEQWIERIETFLGIPKNETGKIGQGKNKVGKKITVATIQSLVKETEKQNESVINAFGTILVDECHHIPAEIYRNTIAGLQSYYLYGLTATPFRKYNDGKLIFINLGDIIAEIKSNEISTTSTAKIVIRNTNLDIPYNSKTDKFETLSKILVHDSERNKLIIEDVKSEISKGKKVVIITERKEHIDSLNQFLKQSYETIALCGDDSESNKKEKWKVLSEGNYQALITTGQYFGEGTDLQNANCLFIAYPFSFEGKLIQYIGRVQRSEIAPTIYDYRDIKIDYLNKLFLKRNSYYRKIEKQATLFDDHTEEISISKKNTIIIEQKIKVPIDELEFRYGSVAFRYNVSEINLEIEFDIENSEVRPEFEVLKPYFAKALKSKNTEVFINAEIENGEIVSQKATSNDIEKINRELIEGLRFRFVSKIISKKSFLHNEGILDINQIQEENKNKLYNSGEEFLEDILREEKYRHHRQLRYLSLKHEKDILKLRFVLSPFSFVFLLEGNEQYHVIFETLDTEEATYIWHIDKNKEVLKNKIREIDQQLSIIRNKGRQSFLETNPENFSRIIHDYTEEQKGFIIWKDLLEERIV